MRHTQIRKLNTTKGFYYLLLMFFILPASVLAQVDSTKTPEFDPLQDSLPRGVSVSPPTVRFALKPGTSQTRTLKITNDTEQEKTFQIRVQDYMADDINRAAETSVVPDNYKYGLKKWLFVTPSVVTLQPGDKININVMLDVPQGDENAHAGWSIILIDELKEKQPLADNAGSQNAMGLGIIPTMGFGVWVYQNPPNIKNDQIELSGFSISNAKDKMLLRASNRGEGIGFCIYYVELLNIATGETIKVPPQSATLLPGASREFALDLPKLPPGSYNALGVLDYGSTDYVETAEMDFTVK